MTDYKETEKHDERSIDSEVKQPDCLENSEKVKKKRSYKKEKELFMKGFKIGQTAGFIAVTITGLTTGIGIAKTIAKIVIRKKV